MSPHRLSPRALSALALAVTLCACTSAQTSQPQPLQIGPPATSPGANFPPASWAPAAAADAFAQPREQLRQSLAAGGERAPGFQAPSAAHCRREVRSHEEAGSHPPIAHAAHSRAPRSRIPGRPRLDLSGNPLPPLAADMSDGIAESAPAAAVAADKLSKPGRAVAAAAPSAAPAPPALRAPQEPVTAGMVDDNANFGEYLAYRERTQVTHRPRDVRQRLLLQVRDPQGRAVPDAEVSVRAGSGAAMWARTDASGRAWIAPDAFDPSASQLYEATARQGRAQASTLFQRGQASAIDITLDAAAPAPRARLDLVFLIDATGSMGDEIAKLTASLRSIADEVARLPSRPDTCFGLVAYRDKTDAFLLRSHDFTHDLNAFQQVLNQLRADGGGDEPEAMNEALWEAVHALSWRGSGATRLMVLLADAPPHLDYPGPQYDETMMAALGKGIKIFSVGASGLNRQGEYIQRQIAQYTGGRFVFLTYRDARNPGSGPGRETVHDVSNYSVETLDRLIVRLVSEELAQLPKP